MRSHNLGVFFHIHQWQPYPSFQVQFLFLIETGLNRQENFSFGATASPNILDIVKARQDLLLPYNRTVSFEPSLCGTFIHAAT